MLIRKSQPTPGDVHVNRPLTNISIAFLQDPAGFVADIVFPNIPSQMRSDLYWTYDRGQFNRNQMAKRAPSAESAGVGYNVSTDSFFCDVYGLHHDIPDQVRQNADSPLQPDREAVELLSHQALIRREVDWAATFFADGVWTNSPDGVAGVPGAGQFQQWDQASSNPIEDIETAKRTMGESTGYEPNVLVLGRAVWGALRNHPDIVDRVKYGQAGVGGPARVNLDTVAAVCEVDRIVVSRAIQNTALEGASNVHAYIAGKHALLAYVPASPGLMTPAAGYTFSWSGLAPGAGPAGQAIRRFRMEHLRSDRVEIEMAYDQKLVSADLGYFFNSAVA